MCGSSSSAGCSPSAACTSCWIIQSTEKPCCQSVTGYARVLKVHPLALKVFQVLEKKKNYRLAGFSCQGLSCTKR